MFISKLIMTDIGVMVSHHVVSALHVYPLRQTVHIDVESFVSEEAQLSGALPVVTNQFEFAGAQYPFGETHLDIEAAYDAVRTTDMFRENE